MAFSDFRSGMGDVALRCFYGMAGALQFGDDITAGKLFIETWKTLSKDERNGLRDIVNEHLLSGQEKEVSAHGIRRSFRFWSVEEKAALMALASDVIAAFRERLGVQGSIGYGTALAIARSNDLIPHDDDADLIVAFPVEQYPTFQRALKKIREIFAGNDFRIGGSEAESHCKFGKGKFTLDVFPCIQEGPYISSIPGPRKKILFSDVFPTREIEIFGVKVPAPHDLEKYLSKVYGESWKVPDPLFGHSWDNSPFADLKD